jgi:hypothetical protein
MSVNLSGVERALGQMRDEIVSVGKTLNEIERKAREGSFDQSRGDNEKRRLDHITQRSKGVTALSAGAIALSYTASHGLALIILIKMLLFCVWWAFLLSILFTFWAQHITTVRITYVGPGDKYPYKKISIKLLYKISILCFHIGLVLFVIFGSILLFFY